MFQPDLVRVPRAAGTPPAAFPPRGPERLLRRGLLRAATLYHWLEVALDRLVSPSLNPLYHTGTIAVFSLAVATVTGIYLFLFYRVGVGAAHRSVEAIMAHPLGVGALMRSLHRYSSDAALLAAALHGLKMLLDDRFWGARWIGWVSGLGLLGLVWCTGVTGYWLVWDVQALVLSLTTARFLDALPLFAEPLVQTFVRQDRIQNFLFFVVLFLHITVPLLLGAVYWLHVMRLSRARFFPPRLMLGATGTALGLASLLRPAASGPPADPARLPGTVAVDWVYFAYLPLTHLDPRTGWVLLTGAGVLVLGLPWLLRGRGPARARVESEACTGCTRCFRDCPYDAIVMVPRSEGTRRSTRAVVNPARCTGCGVCIGACDTGGITLGDQPVQVLGAAVAASLERARAGDSRPPVVAFACRLHARLAQHLELAGSPGIVLLGLPCVGLLHPTVVRHALDLGAAGVFVAGCVPDNCQFREGARWLVDRLAGLRPPAWKSVERERVGFGWYGPVEVRRCLRDLRAFQEALA
jgi:ferredoxin/coenzyme F420-reducing hydrogenase delta subunit